jgi:prepilin-type N-terminal cleavage/methylation domain-containing protein
MKTTNRQRGQTLVEVLISLAVISIILSMTTALYIQMFQHYSKTTSDVDAQSQARFAMGRVTQALRQAMTDPQLPPGPPISYPTPTSGPYPAYANSVTFTDAVSIPADADYQNSVYQNVTIATSATPPPGHLYPDLVITTSDLNNNPTGSTIIGRDIKSFTVYAVTQSIYDVQITTAPAVGISQNNSSPAPGVSPYPGFTLNSRVFISYYQ